jgi:hypothetical protein
VLPDQLWVFFRGFLTPSVHHIVVCRAVTGLYFGGGGLISLLVYEKGMKKGGIEAKKTLLISKYTSLF